MSFYFVQADAGSFVFPAGVNAILSTFALTLMPDYARIVRAGREALTAGGRFAILDLKESATAPRGLTRFIIRITRPLRNRFRSDSPSSPGIH